MAKQLWRTTAVIWTDFDPSALELDDLAREAMTGDGYCSEQNTELVTDKAQFPETEFFDCPGEDEDEGAA